MDRQMKMSYKAVYGAVNTIRMSILSHAEDADMLLGGEIELDEAYFGGKRKGNWGRGAAGKVPVFGILERNGIVHVNVVPNVTAETLLGLTVKKVCRGSVRLHGQVQELRQPHVLRIQASEGGPR
jgi:transposase